VPVRDVSVGAAAARRPAAGSQICPRLWPPPTLLTVVLAALLVAPCCGLRPGGMQWPVPGGGWRRGGGVIE
jgi:hypothetical protein